MAQEAVKAFIDDNTLELVKWREAKDEIARKTKVANENECALATLENNIGSCEGITELQTVIDNVKDALAQDVNAFKEQEKNIQQVKKECADMIKSLLAFYHKIGKGFFDESAYKLFAKGPVENDPIAVEAAKTFWSDIDNHQLRADPPICDLYKDAFRTNQGIGEISASNDVSIDKIIDLSNNFKKHVNANTHV